MEAIECIMTRRSTRKFLPDMPSDNDLDKILQAAVHAPSGMSRQTWHFTVVTNKDWLARMNASVMPIVADASRSSNLERNGAKGYSCNYHAPVLIIASADPQYNTSEDDCACALQNMFLASHALGLAACWINQLGKDNTEKIRDLLTEAGIPKTDMVYGCCAIGYADGAPSPRKPRADCIRYYK